MLLRIAHVNLSIDDVDAACRFYGEVLGLTPVPRPADAGRPGCWFVLGAIELHLSIEPGADNTAKRHVAFEVADLDALRARLVAAGVPIEEGRPMGGVCRHFFARDPARNRIEFYVLQR